ncbi:MAG: threonine synthase, partial [Chaenotheca gracillima]
MSSSFMDQDDGESLADPSALLDNKLLERLEDLKRMISSSIRRLEEQLRTPDKVITPQRHEAIASAVCLAGGKVVEFFRPWISTVESINLMSLGSSFQTPQLPKLSEQKQRAYDLIADMILNCQAVAAPLADEWSEVRAEPLEVRLQTVRSTAKQLDTCTSELFFCLQTLHSLLPKTDSRPSTRDEHRDY